MLICIGCNTAIRTTLHIETHLDKYYNTLKYDLVRQKKYEKYVNNLKTLDIIDYTIETNIIPPNRYYFSDLVLFNSGYRCLSCNYITLNLKNMKRHVNTHGVIGRKGVKSSNKGYLINQFLQYLYKEKKAIFLTSIPNTDLKTNIYINNQDNPFNSIILTPPTISQRDPIQNTPPYLDILRENLASFNTI